MRTLALLSAMAGLAFGMRAQFELIGTTTPYCYATHSLANAGTKFIQPISGGVTLLNLDLTPYLTLTYPPAPTGYTYISHPSMILEETFDNDPSTIEFMIVLSASGGGTGVRILRQDGSILFEEMGLSITGVNSATDLFSSAGVFQASDGFVYMQLGIGQLTTGSAKLYRLPGTLPCLTCEGSGMGFESPSADQAKASLTIHPNPGSGPFTVIADLRGGHNVASLAVRTSDGRQVWQGAITSGVPLLVPLDQAGSGAYVFTLLEGGRPVAAKTAERIR